MAKSNKNRLPPFLHQQMIEDLVSQQKNTDGKKIRTLQHYL